MKLIELCLWIRNTRTLRIFADKNIKIHIIYHDVRKKTKKESEMYWHFYREIFIRWSTNVLSQISAANHCSWFAEESVGRSEQTFSAKEEADWWPKTRCLRLFNLPKLFAIGILQNKHFHSHRKSQLSCLRHAIEIRNHKK